MNSSVEKLHVHSQPLLFPLVMFSDNKVTEPTVQSERAFYERNCFHLLHTLKIFSHYSFSKAPNYTKLLGASMLQISFRIHVALILHFDDILLIHWVIWYFACMSPMFLQRCFTKTCMQFLYASSLHQIHEEIWEWSLMFPFLKSNSVTTHITFLLMISLELLQESQNGWSEKGPPSLFGPTPAQIGTSRTGHPGSWPGSFWRSPRRGPHSLSGQSVPVFCRTRSAGWCSEGTSCPPI